MRLLGSLPLNSGAVCRASKDKGSKETGTGAWSCKEKVRSRSKGKEEREERQAGRRGKTTVCLEKLMGSQNDGTRDMRG